MFAKTARLNRSKFSTCFKSGKRISGSYATIIVCKESTFACAVVVSKKVARKAHERNTIRRRVYALLRELQLKNSSVGWFIVTIKPSVTSLSKANVKAVLLTELGQALKTR